MSTLEDREWDAYQDRCLDAAEEGQVREDEEVTRLVLEPPCAFINTNNRLDWRKKKDLTKAWRTLAHELATDELNRRDPFGKVHVYAWFRFADNRRRDVANLYGTVKAAIDGAVEAGLLPLGDHDEVFIGPDMRREYPNGTPRLTLEIREIQ